MDKPGHRGGCSAGTGPLAKASRPHPWTSQAFPEWDEAGFTSYVRCRTQAAGRSSGSHGKGGEFWPAAREGMGEDAEMLPGCFSTLLSHAGPFETSRQVAGGRGEGAGSQRVKLEESWEEGPASAYSPLPPFQGRGPPKASFSGCTGGPHPQGQGTSLSNPSGSQGIPQPGLTSRRSLPPPWAAPSSFYPQSIQRQARRVTGGQ